MLIKFVVSASLWLTMSLVLASTALGILPALDPLPQILLFGASLVITAPIAVFIAREMFTKPKQTANEDAPELPLDGTITGPECGLPQGVRVEYKNALYSPKIKITKGGFIIDFGNGVIGMTGDQQYMNQCNGSLQVNVITPRSHQSID